MRKNKTLLSVVVAASIIITVGLLLHWLTTGAQGGIWGLFSDDEKSFTLSAPRGNILGRDGSELVSNRLSYDLVWFPDGDQSEEVILNKVAQLTGKDVDELWHELREYNDGRFPLPIRLVDDIDEDTVTRIKENQSMLPGVLIAKGTRRKYPHGNLASHLLGYLGEVSDEDLKENISDDYRGGDLIGKIGLEKSRDKELRGEKGHYKYRNGRDEVEQSLRTIKQPIAGDDLHLTIDVGMQRAAEKIFEAGDKAGAVVAMEVHTGRVLTAVSAPSVNLNDFISGISGEKWEALLENPKHPLINKVVQATYPPGATYNMVTALAGLEKGVIDEETVFYCPGYYSFGNRTYRCWKHSGHGPVNLIKAIGESCDVFFYQVGQRVGVDALSEFAEKMGLGQKTGIEMEYEKSGLAPTKEWKLKNRKRKWQEGETLLVAIGQGYNLASPLQISLMTAALANGGKVYRPQLVEKVIDQNGIVIGKFSPVLISGNEELQEPLALIRKGLEQHQIKIKGSTKASQNVLRIAGERGAAQVVKLAQYKQLKEEDLPYKYRNHQWYTCYAPADTPEIAVTVLVEHSLPGGSDAEKIARAVLEQYFE